MIPTNAQPGLGQPVTQGPALPELPLRHRALYAVSLFIGSGLALPQLWSWLVGLDRSFSPQIFFFYFLPALLLAVFGGLSLYREVSRRWEPVLFEQGITLRRGSRSVAFRFDEIREVVLREKELLVNGALAALQWEVTLRSDAARATFHLRTPEGHADQAGEFLGQLRAGLAAAAGQRLREGETLAGQGWRLTGAAFHAGSQDVPFDQVAGAGLAGGGRVALWRMGEEKPFFTVPSQTANAMVLHDILAARLPTHEIGLGRFLFEKRARRLPAILLGTMGLASFGLAAWLYLEEGVLSSIAMTGIVCGVLLTAGAYLLTARGFRCYERGLVKFSPLGEQELRFTEVANVDYRSSPLHYKNIYIGTNFHMTFHRRGESPLKVSAHSRRAVDPDLERLRDRLTGVREPR